MSIDSGDPDSIDEASAPPDVAAASAGEMPVERAGGQKRLVEIRCGFAERARKEAEVAGARVVEAKRLLDDQTAAVTQAQAAIDPAATHVAKDGAHRSFRAAVAAARNRGQVEAAAVAWLEDINKINAQGRVAQARLKREREEADSRVAALASLSDTAEAAAVMADAAMAACDAARAALEGGQAPEAVDALDAHDVVPPAEPEAPVVPSVAAAAGGPTTPPAETTGSSEPAPSSPAPPAVPSGDEAGPSMDWLVIDIRAPDAQVIVRLMRRDRGTLNALVDRLAGTDLAARSCWQLLLSNFVDSVVAAAIEDSCLEFPAGNPFWDQFTPDQSCEVARGLAALGFRYDGFGTFADGRVPTHRDLALAVGAAGLLPVRIRHWPKQDEAEQLFREVRVTADAFIAARAPTLTLGELVRLLGRRAERLADLWNDWPQVRPLLFATSL